jgi:hypothetical protein
VIVARAMRLLGAGVALLGDELAFAVTLGQGPAMLAEQVYAYALAGVGPGPDVRFDGAPSLASRIPPPA